MPMIHMTPTVTDYGGHRRILFPVGDVNLKAYTDAILTQISWTTLGIEPKPIHKQPFKPAAYCVKPQGQGSSAINSFGLLGRNSVFQRPYPLFFLFKFLMQSISVSRNSYPRISKLNLVCK